MGISIFEVIGPVMIGPSSSHTAGMARIGQMVGKIINEDIQSIQLEFSPKLSSTYKGHRSDVALIGGVMGMETADPDIRDSLRIAADRGIDIKVGFLPEGQQPENTILTTVTAKNGSKYSVRGTSVGGGSIAMTHIDGQEVEIVPGNWNLVVWSEDPVEDEKFTCSKAAGPNGYISCSSFAAKPENAEEMAAPYNPKKVSLVSPAFPYGISETPVKVPSCEEACELAKQKGSLFEVAIDYEVERSGHTRETVYDQMLEHVKYMRRSVELGQESTSLLYGLAAGDDSDKLMALVNSGSTISGGLIPEAVAKAIGVMELNGSMGCIVAAPTAGSAGIVPGSLFTIQEHYGTTDDELAKALFVSGLLGVITDSKGASFSGSVGGCQGEIGISSAIAAAGIASLFTEDPKVVMHAMALCLKNLLGLVCDPIAGPIEIPCIKRNAVGTANAFISADMARAGIQSFIPPDEVIEALIDVQKRLPTELRCAAVGGLAATETAREVRRKLSKKED